MSSLLPISLPVGQRNSLYFQICALGLLDRSEYTLICQEDPKSTPDIDKYQQINVYCVYTLL